MYSRVIEAKYPVSYRRKDFEILGRHLRHRHSVALIGMKRVGISNFLRFFFSHPKAQHKLMGNAGKHLFIVVDLNDLIEREIFPLWTLMLKRISDTVERVDIATSEKKKIENLFLKTIQINDHIVTMDNVRIALEVLIENDYLPTVFLVHFDRVKEKVTPAFIDNLGALISASGDKLSYVFTSFRQLTELSPEAFLGNTMSFYRQNMYMTLASTEDLEIIIKTHNDQYQLKLSSKTKEDLFRITGGHVQYLQLSLLALRELDKPNSITEVNLLEFLLRDERIILQSEELWESLTNREKETLRKIIKGEKVTEKDKLDALYLWDTEMLFGKNNLTIFSVLFGSHVKGFIESRPSKEDRIHFTKKELALFTFLQNTVGEICERDMIIDSVWPEYVESGISDWAIDRLVARLRTKLRSQKSKYEIKTIRTRGYQLLEK